MRRLRRDDAPSLRVNRLLVLQVLELEKVVFLALVGLIRVVPEHFFVIYNDRIELRQQGLILSIDSLHTHHGRLLLSLL